MSDYGSGQRAGMLRAVIMASGVLVLAGCGSQSHGTGEETFGVRGKLAGNTYFGVTNAGECTFVDGVYGPATPVVLRGADNQILASTTLSVGDDQFPNEGLALCSLKFNFDNVKKGETAYQITVGSVGPIVVTEHQLRDKDFNLQPRNEMTRSQGEPIITVYPPA